MEFKPNGKYEWHGVFIDDEDEKETTEFVVFADDIETAVKDGNDTLPPGSTIVFLSRGRDVSDMGFELPDDHPTVKKFKEAKDKKLH